MARTAAARASAGGSIRARGVKGPRRGASAEEKIDFLVEQDATAQSRLAALEKSLEALPDRWNVDIEAAAAGLMKEQRERLQEHRDEYLRERRWGLGLLVGGLVLSAFGNLI